MKSSSEAYKNAGVDITAGYKSVELMKKHIERTLVPGVISEIGGFGGFFSLKDAGISNMTDPVLFSVLLSFSFLYPHFFHFRRLLCDRMDNHYKYPLS